MEIADKGRQSPLEIISRPQEIPGVARAARYLQSSVN